MGDLRQKFETLVLPHLDAAYNLARWLTRNDQDAEDVVQDALLRAYRYCGGLRGEARPWLLAIVRNACFSWLRENRPADIAGGLDEQPEQASSVDGPEVLAAREMDRRLLNEAISALPAQFREVLVLRE
ncbi:MAG TPA: sigma-70 family RNA polymerase sigma factor, partial [Burkholderiales bacterium]|nr:sigma-70 family RNA polymerase sigma factor [Burkholderiales bacterium]